MINKEYDELPVALSEEEIQIRQEFSNITKNNREELFKFFTKYPFISCYEMAFILDVSPYYVRLLRRKSGIPRRKTTKQPVNKYIKKKPPIKRVPRRIWSNNKKWWVETYKNHSIYDIMKMTGIKKTSIYHHLRKFGIKTRGNKLALHPKHPCCNKEWLYNNYVIKKLSKQQCAKLAGVSEDTISSWLIKHKIRLRYVCNPTLAKDISRAYTESENS